MSNLGNTIGERINQFDNLACYEKTIENFNKLFPECPIKEQARFVDIEAPASNNCRNIMLYGHEESYVIIKHKMYADNLYTIDKDLYLQDESDLELFEINGVML